MNPFQRLNHHAGWYPGLALAAWLLFLCRMGLSPEPRMPAGWRERVIGWVGQLGQMQSTVELQLVVSWPAAGPNDEEAQIITRWDRGPEQEWQAFDIHEGLRLLVLRRITRGRQGLKVVGMDAEGCIHYSGVVETVPSPSVPSPVTLHIALRKLHMPLCS
jgi:hypothetical protein